VISSGRAFGWTRDPAPTITMKTPNLKQILRLTTDRIKAMYRDIIDVDENGDVPEATVKALEGMTLEDEAEILDAAVAYKELGILFEGYQGEIERLQSRAKKVAAQAERIKTVLKNAVPAGTKFSDERVAIAWRKSTETIVGVAAEELAPKYTRVKIEANKTAIKAALEAGKSIDGCFLKENQNIQIK
jgi:hypothetical protein